MRFGHAAVGIARGAKLLFSAFEDGGEMWTGQGARAVRSPITFDEPFFTPPLVHVALGMWDIEGGSNQRVDIGAERITPKGFDIVFRTWGDTRVARVRAEWIAFGPVRHSDDFDL